MSELEARCFQLRCPKTREKNAEMTTLVLAIYAERLLLVAVFTVVVVEVSLVRPAVGAM